MSLSSSSSSSSSSSEDGQMYRWFKSVYEKHLAEEGSKVSSSSSSISIKEIDPELKKYFEDLLFEEFNKCLDEEADKKECSECESLLSFENFAELYINHIVNQAEEVATNKKSSVISCKSVEPGENGQLRHLESIPDELNIAWPTINEFTIESGIQKIKEYITYFWKLEENWQFTVNFMNLEKNEISDDYKYEVLFSIPCKQYPIAQATASVYYTIEASKIKTKNCTVDVYYYFEANQLIHNARKYRFQEQWLFYIVDSKLKVFQKLHF